MYIKKISNIYFSPTDSTKDVLSIMTNGSSKEVESIDLTNYSNRNKSYTYTSEELIIIGVPVYGGRVPEVALERIQKLHGMQTPAILVVTYGNRDYDDALLELKNVVEACGFITVAAATIITEHSIMHSVAQGRPDEEDREQIAKFVKQIWTKIDKTNSVEDFPRVEVKGNSPYKEYHGIPLKPKATKACIMCGICASNCPVNAISLTQPNVTMGEACISCMRCMKMCPTHARKLNKVMYSIANKSFVKKYSARRELEIFI